MTWEKRTDRLWLAKGKVGQFAILKNRTGCSVAYKVHIGDVVRFRFFAKDVKTAKKLCEENYNWEK